MSAELTDYELKMLDMLRRRNPAEHLPRSLPGTLGERMADRITSLVGSWRFIIIQSALFAIWVAMNVAAFIQHWDPYPFILLNLMLSFQAAYTAPIIMMSQNREMENDRKQLQYYYEVNVKSELELELLHQKMDDLMQMMMQPIDQRKLPESVDL